MPEFKIEKFKDAHEKNMHGMAWFRENRTMAIRQITGHYYGDNKNKVQPNPVNLLELATNIYTYNLAPRLPQALVKTRHKMLRPFASTFQLALNHLMNEIRFDQTLRAAAQDALFGMGIIKVGMSYSHSFEMGGYLHDVGQPYADVVSIDNFVIDIGAANIEQATFMGHRYEMPTYQAQEYFEREDIQSVNGRSSDGTDRARSITSSSVPKENALVPHSEFWEIWFPLENIVRTFEATEDGKIKRLVEEREYKGHEFGPYHFLVFKPVPDNIMPLSTVSTWLPLHLEVNRLHRKLFDQADAQKNLVTGDSEEAVTTIRDAKNQDAVVVNDGSTVKNVSYGGIDQQTHMFADALMNSFSFFSGNIESLAGLGPQADTARQDLLINESANQVMQLMQGMMLDFTSQVSKALAWHLMYDPMVDLELTKRIPGTTREVPVRFAADAIEGDYLDFNFSIEPFSLRPQTPEQRLEKLIAMLGQVYMPMGAPIDMETLSKVLADLSNLPELEEILSFPDGPAGGALHPVGTPPTKVSQAQQSAPARQSTATASGTNEMMKRGQFAAQGTPGLGE